MKQEEKQLLLKDLYARLPYRVIAYAFEINKNGIITDVNVPYNMVNLTVDNDSGKYELVPLFDVKPYLRPMSSMTEEECFTLSKLKPYNIDAWKYIKTPIPLYVANIEQFDFFLRHHLDWRGLIPMGLALEAPEGMYKED